jgi:hypothetical protein
MPNALTIKGVPEVQRALFKYNAELASRATRLSLRMGANYMKGKIKASVPVKTGVAKRTLKVYNSKRHSHKKDGIISVWVGWRGGTGGRYLKGKAGNKDAYYMSWVEYGYNAKSQKAGVGLSQTLGLIAKGTKSARKLAGIKNRGKGRRFRQARLVTRYGGKRVEGQHIVERAFDQHGQRSALLIIDASNAIAEKLAKELGFSAHA